MINDTTSFRHNFFQIAVGNCAPFEIIARPPLTVAQGTDRRSINSQGSSDKVGDKAFMPLEAVESSGLI